MEYYVNKNKSNNDDYYKRVVEEEKKKYATDLSTVSVNSFLDKANKYFSSADKSLKSTGYSTASKNAEDRRKQAQELRMEALGVDRYLDVNKSSMDENTYKTLKQYVSEIGYETAKVTDAFDTAEDYYSQFSDREKFNDYRENIRQNAWLDKYQNKNYTDLNILASKMEDGDEKNWVKRYATSKYTPEEGYMEVSRLENVLDEYNRLLKGNVNDPKNQERLRDITSRYGGKDDLEALISQTRQRNTLYDRELERQKLTSVGDRESANYDPEFDYWAKSRAAVPTRQDIENYDIMMDNSTWQVGDDGRMYDSFGNEIDTSKRDANGKVIHPAAGSVNTSDRLGIYLAAKNDTTDYSVAERAWGTVDQILAEGDSRHWDRLSEDQINTYYYYLNKQGADAANRYLDLIQDTVNKELGKEQASQVPDSNALKALFGIKAGIEQFEAGMGGFGRQLRGESDYVAPSAEQYAAAMVREDLDGLWGVAYDTASTAANMAPSVLVGTLANAFVPGAGFVGSLVMGAGASGNAYDQMINEGYTVDQARTYGALVGVSEVALERLLGGISEFGGSALSKGLQKAMTAADNALLKVAVNAGDTAIGRILSNMISEGTEEGLQEILGTWLKNLITHSEENVNWEEVAYSTLLGALTGGVFEGVSVGANALQTNAVRKDVGKTIMAADGGVDALKALALDVSGAGSKLVNQAEKVTGETAVGKNFTGKVVAAAKNSANQKRIGKLYEGVRSEVSAQNRADIAKLLGEKGFSSTSAKNIAEAIAARINGDETNKFQDMVLDEVKDNSAVNEVVKTVLTDEASMVSKRTTDLDLYSRGVAVGKGIAPTKTERPDYDVSEDGKTILHNADGTAREVEVKKVSSIENGKVKLELNDGTVVDADQVSFASTGEAWTYSVLAEIGATAEEANDILSFYEGSTDIDRVAYARGVQEAYRYGTIGVPAGQISQTGFAARMSDSAMKYAYNVGRKQSVIKAGQAQNKLANRVIGKGQYYNNFTQERNGVHYDDVDITTEKLNARQKTGIQMAEFLAAIGMNVHVYKSEKVNGQYVGDNGTYYGKDGSIHIDLMSGSSGQGYVGYTISHEFTHFIKDWSPEKFKVFADALFEEMGKSEVEVNKMVAATLARIKTMKEYKNKTEDQLWDIAYDEVVAEMCETMLTDTDAAVRIAENLKKTDSELLNKIIEFFNNLLTKLKDVLKINVAYKDSAPDSYIARQARETIQKVERLRDLYAEAAAGAVQSFNAAKENTSEYAESSMSNEEAFEDSEYAVLNQIRPPYSDGSKAFNTFTENLDTDAKKTFDLFYGFYQKSRITNTMSVTGKRVKAVNISSLYLLAQDWNDMLAKEPKWATAAKELADFLPADVRKRMNMNEDGTLNPTMLEKEFKMPSSMAQRLVDALPVEAIEATYRMGNKEITLPEGKARQSVGGEAYRRAIIDETRKLFADGKLKQVSIGTMSKDRWGSLGFLAANGKTGASGDFTTVCPQMMFNRGCWYCYRRAAMEKGVNNKLVAQSVWYTGEILRIKDSDITALNRNGGLRIQSFGDWMPHFSAMLADVLYDAEQRGLQVKIITKEPSMINYIAALREQGVGKNLYFNLSADYTIERGPAKQAMTADSLDAVNPERPFMRYDNSFWWKRAMTVEEAAKYREKYPWVNVRIAATTQEEFIRGLKDPKVDVVTGYHGNIREYERVDSATGEHKVQVEALGDAGMPRFAFNPMTNSWTIEYEGKTSTHKKLAEAIVANNLQMEYYTKTCCITGRCATCQGKCGALARDFNVKNATNRDAESVAYWQREMQYGIEPEFGDMTTQSEVRYALRGNYWYPKMTKTELHEIEDIAKNRVYKDKNYLGIDVKWLYNTEKGHEYFALYSTTNVKDPTILYASKNNSANREYEFVQRFLKREEQRNGQDYGAGGLVGRLLSRFKDASSWENVYDRNTARSGSSSRNGAVYSRNRGDKFNAAFLSCIKNISETQLRASIDEQYQFAVDIEDYATAQRMVNEAAKAAGYTEEVFHGMGNRHNVYQSGHGQYGDGVYFTYDQPTARGYGKVVDHLFVKIGKIANYDDAYKALGKTDNQTLDDFAKTLGFPSFDEMIDDWDNDPTDVASNTDLIDMLMDRGFEGFIDDGNSGFVLWDRDGIEYRIKSADPVTYDDDGNVIPLSKRFDPTNEDIRYSERTKDSVSNRSLLANALESTTQHEVEKTRLQEYKDKIAAMDAEEQKLSDINAQIKEISFGQGPRDTKKLSKLQQEKTKIQNRINTYDKQLLRLESTKVLQNVLTREKQKAYKRAEARGQEALEAYKKAADKRYENFVNKQEEKRRNAVEVRKRTEIRHKIQRVVNELNDLLLNESKTRHVPDSLKKAVAGALSILNMDTVAAEERAAKYAALIAKERAKDEPDQEKIDAYSSTMENILRKGEKMGQKLKELREAYEEIENSTDPDIALAYDPVIAGAIKELSQTIGDTSIMDMSIEQLSDVYDVYKMVLTRVRDANKAMAENIKATISQMASNVISEVRAAGGQHKMRASMLDPVKKFFWNNMKPVYAMEYIGSSTLTHVFNNVRAGEDVWAKDVTEARAYYLDKAKKYGYNNWDLDKKYKFTSTSDLEFELTLEQMLSLYAYSKREQAHDHLRLGGFVFDSNIETTKEKNGIIKYKVNIADAHQISVEILAEIIGKLTSEQLGFVDEMQAYLSTTMGAKGNEVTSKMYGVKLFKEKNYFPLKSASQFMFEQNQVAGEVRIKNSGFTNKVVAKANNPIILSNFMDVWSNHVNDMSMYHAFTLPLEDFNRVFNFDSPKKEGIPAQSVKGTIQNAYTPAAVHYVKQLITDLNGGARTDPTTDIITKMMSLFKKGAVFASASVVIQQPSAIARASALIDTKYFIGPKVDQKKHKILWEELKKYAPVAIIKEMGYFDTHMGKSTQDFIKGKEYEGIKEQFKALFTDSDYRDEQLSKAPALADELAWVGIWEAVKRETKAKYPGLDVKGDPFLKLAGSRFTEVITKTQVYDSVLSRSANMRSKDTGMKMATAFMAEPTTSINMITDALLKGKRGNKKYARKAIGSVIASMLLNSMLVAIVYAGRDDDEDKTYAEKYIESFLGSALDGLNPATYIPFIKDIVSIVQGYDVERSDMAVISDLWNAVQKLKSDKVSAWRKIEDFAGSIAQIFGLPVKNIMRDVRSVYQTLWPAKKQKTTAAGIGYAALSAVGKDVSDQEQLYRAFVNGNVEHLARVEGRYSTKKKANTAMRSAIKEHYLAGDITAETAMDYMVKYCGDKKDDAYWKIEEWNHEAKFEETFSKYDEFYGAVQTGKDLKAIIKKYTDNGVTEETLRSQITDHFKEKYIKMTNAEKAAIKGYLLNAMTVLGNTRQEAEDKIKDWEFEATHGFSYNNRRQEYLEGDITKEQLEDALVNYGGLDEEEVEDYFSDTLFEAEYGFPYNHTGKLYKDGTLSRDEAFHIFTTQGEMSAEKANVKIAELDFEIEHGFSYSEKRDLFINGDITAAELKQYIMSVEKKTEEEANSAIVSYVRDAYSDGEIDRTFAINTMTRYAGVEAEDAENKLRYIDVKKQYPDTYVDDAWVEEYYEEIESSGMSMDVFFEYRNQVKGVTGKGKKEGRLAVINSMPISTAQKDALYYAEGWAKSKIYEAPWH